MRTPVEESEVRRQETIPWIGVLLLFFVTVVVHGRVVRQSFLGYDDDINVTANPLLNPVTPRGTVAFWLNGYAGMYAPVTYTFFALEAWLAERPATPESLRHLDPLIFKLGNLFLHLGCVLGVFALLRTLNLSTGPAFFGAAFFSVHPLHAESVGWVTETKGLLCGLFSILALCSYVTFTRTEGKRAVARGSLATFLFLLALLSKPAGVTVPLMALLLDVGMLQKPNRRSLALLSFWLALAAGFSLLAKRLQPDSVLGFVTSWSDRPLIAGDAVAFYLGKLVFPIHLAPDYGRSPAVALQSPAISFFWLIPVAITFALSFLRHRGIWLTAWGLFLAALIPVLGLVPFEFQDISTVADRYAYLALLGPSLALACWLSLVWRPWSLAISSLVLAVCGVLSMQQVGHWRSDEAIFSHTLRVNPRSVQALGGLGGIAYRQGKYSEAMELFLRVPAENPTLASTHLSRVRNNIGLTHAGLGNPEEAIRYFQTSIEENPNNADVHNNLGLVLESQGRLEDAIKAFRRAVKINGNSSVSRYNLARLLKQVGKETDAARQFRLAFQLQPDLFQARSQYGEILFRQGKTEEAIRQLRLSLRLNPRFAEAHHYLGRALASTGQLHEGLEHFRTALQILPGYVEARTDFADLLLANGKAAEAIEQYRLILNQKPGPASQLLLARAFESQGRLADAVAHYRAASIANPLDLPTANHLAWILATSTDDSIRNGKESLAIAVRICAEDNAPAAFFDTLAAAYAELGDFDDALLAARRAMALAEEMGNPAIVAEIRARLGRIEKRQPIRISLPP